MPKRLPDDARADELQAVVRALRAFYETRQRAPVFPELGDRSLYGDHREEASLGHVLLSAVAEEINACMHIRDGVWPPKKLDHRTVPLACAASKLILLPSFC